MENNINDIIRDAIQAANRDYVNKETSDTFKQVIIDGLVKINPSMFFTDKSIKMLNSYVIENDTNTEFVSNYIDRIYYELETRKHGILEEVIKIATSMAKSLQDSKVSDEIKELYKVNDKYLTTYYAIYYVVLINIGYIITELGIVNARN